MIALEINVTRSSMPPFEEYIQEIADIWESRRLSNAGPKHQLLEEKLREVLGTRGVTLFTNGHQALEAALSLFPPGGEVITTPFTFASTTLAIIRCGLIPRFCDIEPENYTLDPERIEDLIGPKTVAILPVHVYGHVCGHKAIRAVADRHGLRVIYDAAHAFGVTENGVSVGQQGDISMFSFHATKAFHTIEGGCLAFQDESLARRFEAWRNFGIYGCEISELVGPNAKMSEFQAAMGLCNLRHLDEQIALRKDAALCYQELLGGRQGIVLNVGQPGVTSNYAYYPVRFREDEWGESRDQVMERLAAHGIGARKYFYPLTSAFPIFDGTAVDETPIAAGVAEEILCLPMYAGLSRDEVTRICETILKR